MHRPAFRRLAVALLVVAGLAFAAAAPAAKDETTLVSRANGATGAGGAGASVQQGMSADGRIVAFLSDANNLSADDADATIDTFARDVVDNTTVLVSRQSAADGGLGATVDSFGRPAVSGTGRFVAFATAANELSSADADGTIDVFVRDLATSTTTLVSRQSGTDGGAGGDQNSTAPSISADGRFIAFASEADNLSSEDGVGTIDVFVRDTVANTTTLVSRQSAADGGVAGNQGSFSPAISQDGRLVAFTSFADNLSLDDNNGVTNIFLRDTVAGTTTWVSRQSAANGGGATDGDNAQPAISGNGRFVAFKSDADVLSTEDDDLFDSVFLRDTVANTTTLVSRPSGAAGPAADEDSNLPAVSDDGRYVAFNSDANNLSDLDNDAVTTNVFLRDVVAGTTTLVSRQSAADGGGPADDRTFDTPAMSGDGRYVAFSSLADSLSTADAEDTFDVFLRDVLGPPPVSGPGITTPGGGTPGSGGPGGTGGPGSTGGPGGSGGADAAPVLTLGGSTRAKLRRDRRIAFTVRSDEACRLRASGTVSVPNAARTFRIPAVTRSLRAGRRTTVRLRLPKAAIRPIRRALRRRARVTVRLALTATDTAGNRRSATRTLRIVR